MGRFVALNMCLALVVLSGMAGMLGAQDLSNCSGVLSDLTPCLAFVLGSESPSSSCCGNLTNAVNTSRTCVCAIVEYGLNNSMTGQLSQINLTLVEELPSLCNINASLSDCGITLNTTASPPSSPQGNPPSSSDSSFAGASLLSSNLSIWKFAFPLLISAIFLTAFTFDVIHLLDVS